MDAEHIKALTSEESVHTAAIAWFEECYPAPEFGEKPAAYDSKIISTSTTGRVWLEVDVIGIVFATTQRGMGRLTQEEAYELSHQLVLASIAQAKHKEWLVKKAKYEHWKDARDGFGRQCFWRWEEGEEASPPRYKDYQEEIPF